MNPNEDPNIQDPSLDQGVLSSLQVPGSPNHASPFAMVIPAWVKVTSDMIIKSKPVAVQKLYEITGAQGPGAVEVPGPGNGGTAGKRFIGAMTLATQGYVVDYYDDALGNDPVVTMVLRFNMNISSVPSINNVGTIKTSLDPKDYPPFLPPPPPPPAGPTLSTNIVGAFLFSDDAGRAVYRGAPGALQAYVSGVFDNGTVVTQGGVAYTAQVHKTLMGPAISFTIP